MAAKAEAAAAAPPSQLPPTADSQSNPNLDKYSWLLRPCSVYKEELRVCKTRSYRQHHEFVHGEPPDCSQWSVDHANCQHQAERPAFEALVLSEMRRRHARLRATTGNTVWAYRDQPPTGWGAPLPEATGGDGLDQRVLAAADEALEASFQQYGVLGPASLGAKVSQCALL